MAMLFVWMEAWVHWAKYLSYEWYSRLKWLVVQVLSIVALLIVLVWLAVFMYGSFYYSYMPAVTHTREVHLQFSTDCDSDRLCSFPSANLSLTRDGQSELMMRGQPYVIVLDLEVPESPVNKDLGMFMVKLQMYSRHGLITRTSRRSALIHYKSALYTAIETWCFLPMFLSGVRHQKQQLSVTLFESYEEDPYHPALGVVVEVESKKLEIYSSTLKIHAKFAGLRYLLYHWPVVSALCGIGTNLFFLVVLTLLSWYRFGEIPDEQTSLSIGNAANRLTLEERRSRIRAILDRERRGHSRTGSSSSFSGIMPTERIHHAHSQPNLSTSSHHRSSSASFSRRFDEVDNLTHSSSASNLQGMASHSQGTNLSSTSNLQISRDSVATTDYDDDDDGRDSEKDNFSTPSSGSRSHESSESDRGLRHRKAVFE